jgi:hypothetical protein
VRSLRFRYAIYGEAFEGGGGGTAVALASVMPHSNAAGHI